jgi:retron-type reverse transcriptase
MGNPKGRKPYGFGGLVVGLKIQRRPEIRQFCSMNSINLQGGAIRESGTDILSDRVTKVIHDIANMKNLTLAYEAIKNNPGHKAFTRGTDKLDGINLEGLNQIKLELLAGKFNFSPINRMQILKPGKKEIIPLEAVSPRDQVVQTAMLQILEPIYENIFKDCSHGFRPNKSHHSALYSLKHKLFDVSWVLKGSISKCYDSIDHKILVEILRKKIQCDKTITLVKKSLKTPFKENEQLVWPKIGISLENSLSPLLCNIYLHEMDLYIEKLKKSFDKRKQKRQPKQYNLIQHTRWKGYLDSSKKKSLQLVQRGLKDKDPLDINFRILSYIRYADDFVIGIRGSKDNCIKVQNDLGNFLKERLSLNLSLTKNSISNFNKEGVFFLGTQIKRS